MAAHVLWKLPLMNRRKKILFRVTGELKFIRVEFGREEFGSSLYAMLGNLVDWRFFPLRCVRDPLQFGGWKYIFRLLEPYLSIVTRTRTIQGKGGLQVSTWQICDLPITSFISFAHEGLLAVPYKTIKTFEENKRSFIDWRWFNICCLHTHMAHSTPSPLFFFFALA